MFFDANVLKALHELRNPPKDPSKIVEVTEEELREAMRRRGDEDWEINMVLTFLRMGAQTDGANGTRIVLKKNDEKKS